MADLARLPNFELRRSASGNIGTFTRRYGMAGRIKSHRSATKKVASQLTKEQQTLHYVTTCRDPSAPTTFDAYRNSLSRATLPVPVAGPMGQLFEGLDQVLFYTVQFERAGRSRNSSTPLRRSSRTDASDHTFQSFISSVPGASQP